MPTPKTAIAEALLQLDTKNETLWTDDGSPQIEAVQHLCNDDKITRQMINDASPGFVRKIVSIDEKTQTPVSALAPAEKPPEPDEELDDMLGDDEQPREILARHVRDAEVTIQEAKAALSEAHRAVVNAERIHAKKLAMYNSKFPPISAAQNIKDHLARQQEILYERVTGQKAPAVVYQNPIDETMAAKRRPNGRNTGRTVNPAPAPYLPRKAAVQY